MDSTSLSPAETQLVTTPTYRNDLHYAILETHKQEQQYATIIWPNGQRSQLTFLIASILSANFKLFRMLIETGADLKARSELIFPNDLKQQLSPLAAIFYQSKAPDELKGIKPEMERNTFMRLALRHLTMVQNTSESISQQFIDDQIVLDCLMLFELTDIQFQYLIEAGYQLSNSLLSSHTWGLVLLDAIAHGYDSQVDALVKLADIDLEASWNFHHLESYHRPRRYQYSNPISLAIDTNSFHTLKTLLDAGVNPDTLVFDAYKIFPTSKKPYWKTPSRYHRYSVLMLAIDKEYSACAEILMKHAAALGHRAFNGDTAYSLAKTMGNSHILNLMQKFANSLDPVLCREASTANWRACESAYYSGADPRKVDKIGRTAFDINPDLAKQSFMQHMIPFGTCTFGLEMHYIVVEITDENRLRYIAVLDQEFQDQLFPLARVLLQGKLNHSFDEPFRVFAQTFKYALHKKPIPMGSLNFYQEDNLHFTGFYRQAFRINTSELNDFSRRVPSMKFIRFDYLENNEALNHSTFMDFFSNKANKTLLELMSFLSNRKDRIFKKHKTVRLYQSYKEILTTIYSLFIAIANRAPLTPETQQLLTQCQPFLSIDFQYNGLVIHSNLINYSLMYKRDDIVALLIENHPTALKYIAHHGIYTVIEQDNVSVFQRCQQYYGAEYTTAMSRFLLDSALSLKSTQICLEILQSDDKDFVLEGWCLALKNQCSAVYEVLYDQFSPDLRLKAYEFVKNCTLNFSEGLFDKLLSDFGLDYMTHLLGNKSKVLKRAPYQYLRKQYLKKGIPLDILIGHFSNNRCDEVMSMLKEYPNIENMPTFYDVNDGYYYLFNFLDFSIVNKLHEMTHCLFYHNPQNVLKAQAEADIEAFINRGRLDESWLEELARYCHPINASQLHKLTKLIIALAPHHHELGQEHFVRKLPLNFYIFLYSSEFYFIALEWIRYYPKALCQITADFKNGKRHLEIILCLYLQSTTLDDLTSKAIIEITTTIYKSWFRYADTTLTYISQYIEAHPDDAITRHLIKVLPSLDPEISRINSYSNDLNTLGLYSQTASPPRIFSTLEDPELYSHLHVEVPDIDADSIVLEELSNQKASPFPFSFSSQTP